ncbi:DUF2177 family protein [Candidatus Gracilibacteria bacterium]|nr:DUF2177 family protein [Candidatus Gracilibacteria bacterium]
MEFLKLVLTFGVGYLVILVGDAIFLGRVVHQFIIDKFGPLVESTNGSINMNLGVGLVAWFVIVMMIFVFVLKSGLVSSYQTALGYGALMGLLMYAMYDLTNLTFLKDYPVSFVMIDIAWGTFLCAMITVAMFAFQNWINTVL